MKTGEGGKRTSALTMAFQPILNVSTGRVFAQEALVRGRQGEGALEILSMISSDNRVAFDQHCRSTAIEMAAGLDFVSEGTKLSINLLPAHNYEPYACIQKTLAAARRVNFPLDRIIFEFPESERLEDGHLLALLKSYRAMGFKTAIDDFGSGYSGLSLLAKFQPDIVKIDMSLIRDIDKNRAKRSIAAHVLMLLADLGIKPICEGIETQGEFEVLRDLGVDLMQGFLFARPELGGLAAPEWPYLH